MQLAPGDPKLSSLGAQGATSSKGQTRAAYLIQKHDLKLDKPVLLNFRNFYDYTDDMRFCAYYWSLTNINKQVDTEEEVERGIREEMVQELDRLAKDPEQVDNAARLRFLRSLNIEGFEDRLEHPRQHKRLAGAIEGYVQVYCEDSGLNVVPAAIELLQKDDLELSQKIGLINCLNSSVREKHQLVYSHKASAEETPLITTAWKTWWEREKKTAKKIAPAEITVLKKRLQEMLDTESAKARDTMTRKFKLQDAPFFAEVLLGESSLKEKIIAAIVLNRVVITPLIMDTNRNASEAKVAEVVENWLAYYQPREAEFKKTIAAKLWYVVADTQYSHMIIRLVTFKFGRSSTNKDVYVSDKIWDAFVVSAPLMLMAQLLIYFLAVPLGITCAVNRGKTIDSSISLGLFFLYSIPPFVAGMLFLLFFSYGDFLKIFPTDRLHSHGYENFSYFHYTLDYLWHAVLPVTCLSLFSLAAMAMYARTSMLDVVGQDYIRTARAKGVNSFKVIYKHALRNALIPILTLFSNFLPAMLGGSVLIETIFDIPGLGRVGWKAITDLDYSTLMALIYVQAIVVLLSILMTDLLYVFVDPRISFGGQGKT